MCCSTYVSQRSSLLPRLLIYTEWRKCACQLRRVLQAVAKPAARAFTRTEQVFLLPPTTIHQRVHHTRKWSCYVAASRLVCCCASYSSSADHDSRVANAMQTRPHGWLQTQYRVGVLVTTWAVVVGYGGFWTLSPVCPVHTLHRCWCVHARTTTAPRSCTHACAQVRSLF